MSHCAAQASVAISMTDPTLDFETNLLGGLNVCNAAIAAGTSQFLYITTGGALYGPTDDRPSDEEHPIHPLSIYGLSKWTFESALRMLMPESIPLKILRLANVYGPRQDPNGEAGMVSIFADRMLGQESVLIFGDGEQTRDFVYIDDVVRAHDLALLEPEPLTLNVSSGVPFSINQLFGIMAEATGYSQTLRWKT